MKVVINKCFGGFGLSMLAVKRLAELQGRDCYFFTHDYKSNLYTQIEDIGKESIVWTAFDIPNPNEVLDKKNWNDMSDKERNSHNRLYEKHNLPSGRGLNRSDKLLIKVVQELGKKASGRCADLKIITIPNGIDYQIEEYDGLEHIAETHRTFG